MEDTTNIKRGWHWDRVSGENRERWIEPEGDLVPFVSRLKREGKKRAYDLGCGIGRHTVYLAREGFEVCASDIATEGLEQTRRWLEAEGLQADVISSDFTTIPYPDGFFEAVIAVNVIYHAVRKDVEACINEVRRVLRPRGLFFVTFNSTESDDWGNGRRIDENTFVRIGGIEDGIPHYFIDRGELDRLMAGFELLRISHKYEWFPELGRSNRAAHWVVWAQRP